MTDLGLIAGPGSSAAYDIDARGIIVGEADLGGRNRAVAWQGGMMTDLGNLGGDSRAEHSNDRCMATGMSMAPSGETHAVLWTRS
jgi:probable HAF family extracellular repeat protein